MRYSSAMMSVSLSTPFIGRFTLNLESVYKRTSAIVYHPLFPRLQGFTSSGCPGHAACIVHATG